MPSTYKIQCHTERRRVSGLVHVSGMVRCSCGFTGIHSGSQRQSVLGNDIDLDHKTTRVHMVGVHTQTWDRSHTIHNRRNGVGTMVLAGFVKGHQQVLVPSVGRIVLGVGLSMLERWGWFGSCRAMKFWQTKIRDGIQSGESQCGF